MDDEALAVARAATYPASTVRSVPADLLDRYFERNGQRYTFRKDLRRAVIFGRNDLVQDAPISRVDLLVCRNTLMYLNAETQTHILARFNFALNETGVLFLGKAEMLLSHRHLFHPIDLKRRFFRKVARSPGLNGRTGMAERGGEPPESLVATHRMRQEALLAGPVATVVLTSDELLAAVNQRADTLFGLSGRGDRAAVP